MSLASLTKTLLLYTTPESGLTGLALHEDSMVQTNNKKLIDEDNRKKKLPLTEKKKQREKGALIFFQYRYLNSKKSEFPLWLSSNCIPADAGLIPCLAQWVKDLALLWLWCRPAAAAPTQPLGWELPYAAPVDLKSKINKWINSKNFQSVNMSKSWGLRGNEPN